MKSSPEKTICILGRQADLGMAELEGLYGADHVRWIGKTAAALDLPHTEIEFERLGGSVKMARVLTALPHDWPHIESYLIEQIPAHVAPLPAGKFTLGMSVYGINLSVQNLSRSLLKIKKALRSSADRSVRIVPNKELQLNTAQVLHNGLTSPNSWELILIRDGEQTLLAQTTDVQDIEAYAARDQARPKRDARVGMLPPKLAQIIVNLASRGGSGTLLDPFCGTGVVLQEALITGNSVVGTDIDERMVDYSRENIEWLRSYYPNLPSDYQLEVGDATDHTWPNGINFVAAETYLGRPLSAPPDSGKLQQIISDVNTILTKSLQNLASQIEPNGRLCLAVPAWRDGDKLIELPLIAKLTDMGYNRIQFQHVSNESLVYFRPNQIVARRLLVLTKS